MLYYTIVYCAILCYTILFYTIILKVRSFVATNFWIASKTRKFLSRELKPCHHLRFMCIWHAPERSDVIVRVISQWQLRDLCSRFLFRCKPRQHGEHPCLALLDGTKISTTGHFSYGFSPTGISAFRIYYTMLYYTILYYAILYYTVLYYAILYSSIPS